MKVVQVDPSEKASAEATTPFADVVVVEPLYEVPDRWDDAGPYQRGFRQALRSSGLFRRVAAPAEVDFTPDLLLRGEVEGRFEYSGGLNFVTWFPGPFLLMHNWRGNRYEYIAQAEMDLLDARSENVVQHYRVSTHHKLIHRSGNPFPMFGAALIIPGVARGAQNVKPRPLYRETLYQEAYPALWTAVIDAIRADRAPHYAALRQEQAERCGSRLNGRPVVGVAWSEFAACQTGGLYAREEKETAAGVETIYVDGDATLEIHVIDGEIVRWLVTEKPQRRSPPPH
jgi:hypothetical protein